MAIDLESAVGNLLRLAGIEFSSDDSIRRWCDFLVKDRHGHRIGIEVKDRIPSTSILERVLYKAGENKNKFDEYWIVIGRLPLFHDMVQQRAKESGINFKLISAKDLPEALGIKIKSRLDAPKTVQAIQIAALESAKSGNTPESVEEAVDRASAKSVVSELKLILLRQFPEEFVKNIDSTNPDALKKLLCIGARMPGVSVLMSDIKNFSHLVREIPRDEMNWFMMEYYRKARKIVWKYGGTFDKFIGDAVLAIFGYPVATDQAAVQAIRCAHELIQLGDELTEELIQQVSPVIVPGAATARANKEDNDKIYTGTRVGIATGEIWVLDISVGIGDMQVSFIGDVINLSARLQSGSAVNGVLIDQATKFKAEAANPEYLKELLLSDGPNKFKGQKLSLTTHQVLFSGNSPIDGKKPRGAKSRQN